MAANQPPQLVTQPEHNSQASDESAAHRRHQAVSQKRLRFRGFVPILSCASMTECMSGPGGFGLSRESDVGLCPKAVQLSGVGLGAQAAMMRCPVISVPYRAWGN